MNRIIVLIEFKALTHWYFWVLEHAYGHYIERVGYKSKMLYTSDDFPSYTLRKSAWWLGIEEREPVELVRCCHRSFFLTYSLRLDPTTPCPPLMIYWYDAQSEPIQITSLQQPRTNHGLMDQVNLAPADPTFSTPETGAPGLTPGASRSRGIWRLDYCCWMSSFSGQYAAY